MFKHLASWILAAILALVSLVSYSHIPRRLLADELPVMKLENVIPESFGDWRALPQNGAVVNPQANTLVNYLYSDVLTRTYVNSRGEIIMLSIAYGRTQSDDRAVHYPEACYPAQGLPLQSSEVGRASIGGMDIPVKRLVANRAGHLEPITYWATVGERVVLNGSTHKIAQMRYSVEGYIPDGMIIRASSIGDQPQSEYQAQLGFLRDMVAAVKPEFRSRFIGRDGLQ
ncbi:MAG: EpsI family protein [Burkholderiales bacterium]|nr:EpsI family protein [Burkholderiales bacterium]MCH2240797.1 EpsI family protein [Aquabacterium sp.]